MNKHIEIVKKWLADPDSVTQKELDQNCADAVAYWAADDDAAYWTADAADAAYAAAAADADAAASFVEIYEALENGDE